MFCLLSFVYLFTKPSLLKSYVWMRFLLHTCTLTETVKVAKQLQVSSDHESLKIIYRLYTMLSMHGPPDHQRHFKASRKRHYNILYFA